MNVSVVVATFGEPTWEKMARRRAIPSAVGQGAAEIVPVHLPHGTLADARNLGATKAEGDWLCFLDADDELDPSYLDEMAYALERWEHGRGTPRYRGHPSSGPLFPLVLLVPAVQYLRRGKVTPPKILDRGQPLYELNWAVIGTLIPRRLFNELGGFNDLAALEDWELWLRAERAGAALVPVSGAVYRVHVREGSRNDDQSLYREIRAEFEGAAS